MDFSFERLVVWQKSRALVKEIYRLSASFPHEEKFGLIDQLRRAAVSVSSNLAEGSGRMSAKEKIHFCEIAYGSLMEVMCQLLLAYDLSLLPGTELTRLRPLIEEIGRLISLYRRSLVASSQ